MISHRFLHRIRLGLQRGAQVLSIFESLTAEERGACLVLSAKNETKPNKVPPIYSADLITRQGLRKLNHHAKLVAVRSPDTCATYNGQEFNVNQLLDRAANFQEGTVSVNADLSRC